MGRQAIVQRGGCKWDLDLEEGIDLSIYLAGMFERRTVKACLGLIKSGDIVLDIGANISAYALHLVKGVGPQGYVIAFEATRFAFAKLQRNLELNPEPSKIIRAEHIVLGDQVGKQTARSFLLQLAAW